MKFFGATAMQIIYLLIVFSNAIKHFIYQAHLNHFSSIFQAVKEDFWRPNRLLTKTTACFCYQMQRRGTVWEVLYIIIIITLFLISEFKWNFVHWFGYEVTQIKNVQYCEYFVKDHGIIILCLLLASTRIFLCFSSSSVLLNLLLASQYLLVHLSDDLVRASPSIHLVHDCAPICPSYQSLLWKPLKRLMIIYG